MPLQRDLRLGALLAGNHPVRPLLAVGAGRCARRGRHPRRAGRRRPGAGSGTAAGRPGQRAAGRYGTTPKDANGDARIFTDGRLHLHAANLPDVPGYYEVWLINPTSMEMFSIGVLRDPSGDALLPLPPNVDLQAYSVVDVSAEQYDNEPAHSGDSLLRGTLTG
ncbi:anti-sigma factor [Micromonospora sp. L32]|uniref:anti-sigma factor n=1 Tax=Micromonospora sp. L32 TaxID=3452214 RepID=UPI003F8BC9CC